VFGVFGGDRGELLLLGRRPILGDRDIPFDGHAVPVVPRFGLADCPIKLELLMEGGVAGDILSVSAQIRRRLCGACRQRQCPER